MNKKLCSIIIFAITFFSIGSAKADGTYAVLDANGNVTNIIVCGSACSGGEFGGSKVVPQVAADPVTGANRGGIWYGPGTTTYDAATETFTVVNNSTVINSITEEENGITTTSTVTIYGGKEISFKFNDTIGNQLYTQTNFVVRYRENTAADLSVTSQGITESLSFNGRKSKDEIVAASVENNLTLINSKIDTLVSLLGNWVK